MMKVIEVNADGIGMEVPRTPCDYTTDRLSQIVRLHFPLNAVPAEAVELHDDLVALGTQYDEAVRMLLQLLADHGMQVDE